MSKLVFYITLFCCALQLPSCGQTKPTLASSPIDTSLRLIKTVKGSFTFFEIDALENVYAITKSNQLKKYYASGDSAAVFNDVKQYNNPTSIDATNPLKLLLYYKNFSTIVVLDRFLTTRNSINLRNNNIFKTNAIATSYDNNIWLYDEQDFKLKKINDAGKPIFETTDWRQIFDEAPASILNIYDHAGYLYLYDAEKGFYVFDYYGSYKTVIPFANCDNISLVNKTIVGFQQNKVLTHNLSDGKTSSFNLNSNIANAKQIRVINKHMYVLTSMGVQVYDVGGL
jgi:hypothetical protein